MAKKLFHYRLSGLDGIYLADGFEVVTSHRGQGITFHDIDGLHRAIGRHLVASRKRLSGKELRFLRRDMNLTQVDLGRMMDVSGQQVARWEKGQSNLPGAADTMMRLVYAEFIGAPMKPMAVLRLIETLPPDRPKREVFVSKRGWRPEKAA